MKLQKNIAISDSGFLFNPATGESFTVNPIGLEIIGLIKEGKSEEEICAAIAGVYETEPQQVDRDLHDFVHMLRQMQILESNGKENR